MIDCECVKNGKSNQNVTLLMFRVHACPLPFFSQISAHNKLPEGLAHLFKFLWWWHPMCSSFLIDFCIPKFQFNLLQVLLQLWTKSENVEWFWRESSKKMCLSCTKFRNDKLARQKFLIFCPEKMDFYRRINSVIKINGCVG